MPIGELLPRDEPVLLGESAVPSPQIPLPTNLPTAPRPQVSDFLPMLGQAPPQAPGAPGGPAGLGDLAAIPQLLAPPTGLIEPSFTPPPAPGFAPTAAAAAAALPPAPQLAPFGPVDVSPLALLGETNDAVRAASDTVDVRRGEVGTIRARKGDLERALALAETPEQQAAVRERLGEVQRGELTARQGLASARDTATEAEAIQESELGRAATRARESAVTNAIADADKVQGRAEADLARNAEQTQAAVIQRDQGVADATRLLERGPQRQTGIMLADIATEALNARLERRTPNFNNVFSRHTARTRAIFGDERAAIASRVESSGDRIADLATQSQQVKAAQAEEEVAIFDRAIRDANRSISLARSDADEARATGLRDDLALARDARAQQAAIERQKVLESMEDRRLSRATTVAKLGVEQQRARKLGAEASIAERKAAGGGGSGRGRGKAASSLLPGAIRAAVNSGELSPKEGEQVMRRGIVNPSTGELLRRGDGTFALATNSKTADTLNEAVGLTRSTNDLINEALVIRGAAGWEPTGDWLASKNGQRMDALSNMLLLLNKDRFGLGVLSGADEVLLKKLQGGDLAGMKDPRPVLEDMQRRMSGALNNRVRQLVQGAQPLEFRQVEAAPMPTAKSLTVRLEQRPKLDADEVVVDAATRLADMDQLRELAIEQSPNDFGKASRSFTAQTKTIIKRAERGWDVIEDALNDELPDNIGQLAFEAEETARTVVAVRQDPDASGEDIDEAERAFDKAKARQARALSPRARKLQKALNEQTEFIDGAKRKTAKDTEKQAQQRQQEMDRAAQSKRDTAAFEAGGGGGGRPGGI